MRIAEAGIWGTTVLGAATARAEADAEGARELGEVTALAERCLLAGLSQALPAVLRALADLAALDTDVAGLAKALPALARSLRYGDVRGTDAAALGTVAAGLAERICVALPPPARPGWTPTRRRSCGGTWTPYTGRSGCWVVTVTATATGPMGCGSGGRRCCGPWPGGTPSPG